MKVYTLTVFESGDFTTSVWGVYSNKEVAEKHKKDLMKSEMNKDGYYLEVTIDEHTVEDEYEADSDS